MHAVGVMTREMARELPPGREPIRKGERRLYRGPGRRRDLARSCAVRGLRPLLVDLLHLGVADEELMVDRIGVRDHEPDSLAGRDLERGHVEVREMDRHVDRALGRWSGGG